MDNEIINIPEPVLRRLVRYHYYLLKQVETGSLMISSTSIADHLNLDSVLVRKDLQYTGLVGRPKTGWVTEELLKAIESTLGWNNFNDVFLVGAGRLGSTLLHYGGFKNYGFNFVAAFDVNPEVVGTEINGIKILHTDKLVNLAERMHIHIGVLTVPAENAQVAANLLVEGGIKAIWNFAPIQIDVTKDVIVVNAQMTQEIAILANKLSGLLKAKLES